MRKRIFYARKYHDKKELRKQEKIKREELEKALRNSGWGEATARQVAAWNPFDVAGSAPFFDPEMMFGLSNGFDIIIGNPPYVQIQSFSGRPEQKAWEQQKYTTYIKTGDVYCLFYERGFNLLAQGGTLTFISSNKWMRAKYGAKLREFFAEKTLPKTLIDFGGFQVFDAATVDTGILILKKDRSSGKKPALQAVCMAKDFTAQTDIAEYVHKKAVPMKELSSESWIISSVSEYAVRKRIEEAGVPLKDWDIAINYGIKTGMNEAFIINGKKKDELIARAPKSAEIIKPVLRGRDIKHYKVEFADLWIIASFPALQIDINRYPAIRDYLKTFGKQLEQNGEPGCRKKTSNKWFEVQDTIAYHAEFIKEKIVYPDIMKLPRGNKDFSNYPYFYLDKKNFYVEATNFMMTGDGIYLIIAVLSSRLGVYAFTNFYSGPQFDEKGFRYKKEYLQNFPVPKLDPAAQRPFEILVDCVLFAHEKGLTSEASTLEWVINVMVYGIYFEEEMKKAYCYINDRVAEVVKPFKPGDTDAFKTEYVKTLALFCLRDKTIYPGMVHSKNVAPVRTIHGEKK